MRAELAPPFAVAPSPQHMKRWLPAAAMAASRGAAVVLQFAMQVAVGALAGPAGLGLLQLFSSWTSIAGECLALGLPARSLRRVAVQWQQGEDRGAATLRAAALQILCASVAVWLLCTAAIALLWWLGLTPAADVGQVLLAVLLAAPLFALLRLGAEGLKACDSPLGAITLENLVAPGVIMVVCVVYWWRGEVLDGTALLLAGLAGIAVALFSVWRALQRRINLRCATQSREGGDRFELGALWANGVLTILFVQLPFVLLPWVATAEAIGEFAVAHKLVNVVTTLLILMAAVFGPAFARAAARGDARALRQLLYRTQQLSLLVFLPLAAGLLIFSEPLGALFSLPPASLSPLLLALVVGQLANAATGLPGVLLNMSGAAGRELRSLLLALATALVLSPWAGAALGALGIAWTFSAALIVKNLVSYMAARRYLSRLEIHP